jgi:hypothetical protein
LLFFFAHSPPKASLLVIKRKILQQCILTHIFGNLHRIHLRHLRRIANVLVHPLKTSQVLTIINFTLSHLRCSYSSINIMNFIKRDSLGERSGWRYIIWRRIISMSIRSQDRWRGRTRPSRSLRTL